ncbi:MAG: hypothetical protein QOJ57_1488 [Thermoleophilaceae bacterium]|nr:hypothetical protein [Thermoleophilaceae bacterium]
MDPIRPIGPAERDLEPIVRVTRPSPDGERERREQPDRPPRRRPAAPGPAPDDDDSGSSLIDVRV